MAIPLPGSDITPTFPTFHEALRYWFKLGCISFGGPAGQLAIMHKELVEKRRWFASPATWLGPAGRDLPTCMGITE